MPFLTKSKTNWKFIGIVLVLAILVGGGILGYLEYFKKEIISLSEFPEIKKPEKVVKDETANWETYENEKYGFEFKYPPIPDCGFCKLDRADEDGFLVNRTSVDIESLEGLTLSEFVDKEMEMFSIESREEHLIDGREAISVSYRFGGMNRYAQATFIKKDDKVIIVSFTAGGFCCTEGEKIYELELYSAILSTFRFVEKVSIFINVESFDLINKTFEGKITPEGTNIKILTTDSTKFYRTAAPGWEKEYFTFSEFYSLLKNWSGSSGPFINWPFTVEGVLETEGVIKADKVYFVAQ